MGVKRTPGRCSVYTKGHVIQIDLGSRPTGKNPCLIHWYGFDMNDLPEATNRANAEYFVRAWNNFDALLSVAKLILSDAEKAASPSARQAYYRELKAAVTQAEKGS